MANRPAFAATVLLGFGAVSTANTNRDGTGTIVDILTAGGSGVRIDEIAVQATGDPADSIITIFIDRTGSAGYALFDEIDLGNAAAASTTVSGQRINREYENLVLPTGAKLGAAITVALTAGVMNVWAFGGTY
jgi:hypothetical protein